MYVYLEISVPLYLHVHVCPKSGEGKQIFSKAYLLFSIYLFRVFMRGGEGPGKK